MSSDIQCGDPAALAGYIYDDCDPAERGAMTAHLATCLSCADEVAMLRATREQLAAWTPPEVRLGFRVVPEDAAPPVVPFPAAGSMSRWQWSALPAWAQAAAALMLFAGGAVVAALMNMDVRYDQAGLTLRTGWQQASAPVAAPGTGSVAGSVAGSATALSAASAVVPASTMDPLQLDARIREVIRLVADEDGGKGVVGVPVAQSGVQSASARTTPAPDDLLRRMREMVDASEARQQRELAFRVSQVVRDVDSQRRADIARIERTVAPVEGVTGEEIQQQRKMLNYLMTVSQTK